MSKVVFNIKKAQFSPITSIDDKGTPTYGEPLKLPGSISLSLDYEGSSDPFYADGIIYYVPSSTGSYSGSFENAWFTEEILKSIYAYVSDTNNNLIETDGEVKEFGMQFACDSDEGEVYFTLFRCASTKPNLNVQTKEGSPTINGQSVDLTINPITLANGMNVIKAMARRSDGNYTTFMDKITLPITQVSSGADKD